MTRLIQRLRALGFTAYRCHFNDRYIGMKISSSSGGPIHDTETVSEAWAEDFLAAIDTTVRSN